MTYDMADDWTQLKDANNDVVPGVFCRKITSTEMGTPISVLKGDQVTVKSDVTKANMNALTTATYPTLTVTAYASQLYRSAGVEFSAYDAWVNVAPST